MRGCSGINLEACRHVLQLQKKAINSWDGEEPQQKAQVSVQLGGFGGGYAIWPGGNTMLSWRGRGREAEEAGWRAPDVWLSYWVKILVVTKVRTLRILRKVVAWLYLTFESSLLPKKVLHVWKSTSFLGWTKRGHSWPQLSNLPGKLPSYLTHLRRRASQLSRKGPRLLRWSHVHTYLSVR